MVIPGAKAKLSVAKDRGEVQCQRSNALKRTRPSLRHFCLNSNCLSTSSPLQAFNRFHRCLCLHVHICGPRCSFAAIAHSHHRAFEHHAPYVYILLSRHLQSFDLETYRGVNQKAHTINPPRPPRVVDKKAACSIAVRVATTLICGFCCDLLVHPED